MQRAMGFKDWFSKKPKVPQPPPEPLPPPVVPPEASGVALEFAEQVRLLHPMAGDQIRVTLHSVEGRARVHKTEVIALSPDAVVPEGLVLDDGLHTAHVAGMAEELGGMLGVGPDRWVSLMIDVFVDHLSLLGASVPFEPKDIAFGQDFMQAVAALDDVMPARQQALQERMSAIGPASPGWDREAGVITFTPDSGAPLELPVDVLGSYSPEMGSWCWAYANSSFAVDLIQAISSLRDRAQVGEIEAVFRRSAFAASEPFAFSVAYLAAERLGQRAVWRWPLRTGVQLFFAIKD